MRSAEGRGERQKITLKGIEIKGTKAQDAILKICKREMCLQRVIEIKTHFSIFRQGERSLGSLRNLQAQPRTKMEMRR